MRKEREAVDYEINAIRQAHRDEVRKLGEVTREAELAK
jgi:hypothetical protein